VGVRTNPIILSKKKKYLLEFIESFLRKESKADIKLTNDLYFFVKSFLRTQPEDYCHKSILPPNSFILELPNWNDINTQYNWYLSQNAQELIQRYIFLKFWERFRSHMNFFKKMSYKNAIYLFIEMNKFPVDYYDMLQKADMRYRRSLIPRKTAKIASQLLGSLSVFCPFCSIICFF